MAVHARRWLPTSGIEWRKGVIVTAHHGVRRDEEIKVLREGGLVVPAKLAGRDPSTDLAVLRIEEGVGGEPQFGDSSALKLIESPANRQLISLTKSSFLRLSQ